MQTEDFLTVQRLLLKRYGPQHWWPGETPFEVMVGAVLTQNTSWRNVTRAIANLRARDLMEPAALYAVPNEELAELIRPAGYFRLKAKRLRTLLDYVMDRWAGSLEEMFEAPTEQLRAELLEINGIGPETADSILLYAAGKASFVVDAYTYRVCVRHGWIEPEVDYEGLKEFFESALPEDVPLYNELHALLVRVGHEHCRRRPKCEGCPLEEMLPEGGPLEPV
jgi:endonuclease-3 related protein